MKFTNKALTAAFISILILTSASTAAEGGASVNNGSAASKHSALAASHGTKASAQLGSAVVATPLIIAGAIGQVSLSAGEKLMENATGQTPLKITDKTITTTPSPQDMMQTKKEESL